MSPAALPPALARRPPARHREAQVELRVVNDPDQARSLLDPTRRTILAHLREPGSSSSVANALDLPRQRVNYHVREMEKEGLLHHIENRRRGNCVERIVQSVAMRFLIDPATPGSVTPLTVGGDEEPDPFASTTLRRAAIRTIDEVRALEEWSRVEGKCPPMLAIEAKVHLRSPAREVEFARELQRLLDEVAGQYNEPDVEGGRDFRVAITGHLVPPSLTARASAVDGRG